MTAALTAGAAEAYRARKIPGGWTGEKGKRVLTAAISAGGVDGLLDSDKHKSRNVLGSVITGLTANHLMSGSRSKSRSRPGDGRRHRSQGHGVLGDIAASGALVAVGKEIYDHIRSKSRGRDRSSSRSDDNSRSPVRRRGTKKRSHSVSAYLSKGLAALGLDDVDSHSSRRRHGHGQSSRYSDVSSDYSDGEDYRSRRRGGSVREVGRFRSLPDSDFTSPASSQVEESTIGASYSEGGHNYIPDSDSDLGSSSDDKRRRKKLRRKKLLATGFATAATISAAHGVVKTMEEHNKRRGKLREGEIWPEEARKRKVKANLASAASIGLAALGVKDAISEWKEVNELRSEHKRFNEEHRERSRKRAMGRARSQSAFSSRQSLPVDSIDVRDRIAGYIESYPYYHP
jgi:hypothetical protein